MSTGALPTGDSLRVRRLKPEEMQVYDGDRVRYLTREEILALPDARPGERALDVLRATPGSNLYDAFAREARRIFEPIRVMIDTLEASGRFLREFTEAKYVGSDLSWPGGKTYRQLTRIFSGERDPAKPTAAYDLGTLSLPNLTESRRLEVAERLASRVGKPVHRAQWRSVRPAVHREAEAHGRSADAELRARVLSTLFDLSGSVTTDPELGGMGLSWDGRALEVIRRRLGYSLPQDLLGPGWRQPDKLRGADLDSGPPLPDSDADPAHALEGKQESEAIEALLAVIEAAKPILSPQERKLLGLLETGEADRWSDAYRRLGVTGSSGRTLKARIIKKVRGL